MKRLLNLWLHQDAVLKTRLDQLPMEGRRDMLFKVNGIDKNYTKFNLRLNNDYVTFCHGIE